MQMQEKSKCFTPGVLISPRGLRFLIGKHNSGLQDEFGDSGLFRRSFKSHILNHIEISNYI